MIEVKKTYGIVIVFKERNENLFLILQNNNDKGSWSFPKGHIEGDEKPKKTALRELKEETGITEVKFIKVPLIHEEYKLNKNGKKFLKSNNYFIGFVKNKDVKIQEEEVYAYKWATFKEALETFQPESRKEVLKQAQKYLKK